LKPIVEASSIPGSSWQFSKEACLSRVKNVPLRHRSPPLPALVRLYAKIIHDSPQVPGSGDVKDFMKEFWEYLDIFQKNAKVPEKFDVTGTRRQKIGVNGLTISQFQHPHSALFS
jgi:hypothetical protein